MRPNRLAPICALALVAAASAAQAPQRNVLALVGAKVFDGSGSLPIEKATLIVRDGRVEAVGPDLPVPQGAERIDVRGKTIVPGLVNAHGHVGETRGLKSGPELYTRENLVAQLRLYARYGITTVMSLGGDRDEGFALRGEQEKAPLDRARLYVAGPVITAKTADEARAAVKALAPKQPNFVKIRVDDNLGTTAKMPVEAWRAVIQEAHAQKLRVAAHVFYLADARSLVEEGADLIAHSVRDMAVDPGFADLLKRSNVCLVPTLTREVSSFVYADEPDFFKDPFFLKHADPAVLEQLREPKRRAEMKASPAAQGYKKALEVAQKNLKTLADAGVTIAMGTDSGPPARFQGYFEHLEIDLMAKSGLTPQQILLAATGDAARCLGLRGKVGTLEPGVWADFVVLGADPFADIKNVHKVESVWLAGRRLP
jgi:imidazolonepropionase-like amidohydrolase